MNSGEIFISRVSAWACGIENSGEWDEWARGVRQMTESGKAPKISFTDPMFRRRLSQISKMTIHVIHDLLPVADDTKIFFLSFRGELSRQYQINKMLIEEKALMPAAFSLSVFNAPPALASMALGLKGGYSAVYPAKNSFSSGLALAHAALMTGTAEELVFVYADEQPPPEYESFFSERSYAPLAFGLLLSRNPGSVSIPIAENDSPHDFLKNLLLGGSIHVS